MAMFLGGKLTLVTGAGSGIGRAVSVLFAKEGSKLALADINFKACEETKLLLAKEENQYSSHEVDVSKSDSVSNLFESVKKAHSRPPDVVINCAGITRDAFMKDMSEEQFDDVIGVNLKGTFLMTKLACKEMIDADIKGSIVNFASVSGKIGNMGQCNYSAAKAGVEAFTKSISKEMGRHEIRCNVVMPGFIDTEMVKSVPDKLKMMLLYQIPLGRFGKPEEVAEICAFLASDRSSYLTGSTIQVSGGLF